MISYLNSKKYFIISLYFFTLLTVGLFTFSDYGISIDEDNTRINGFVSLKYIFEIFFPNLVNEIDKFTNIPSMADWEEQGIGVIFDLPTAFLEWFFQIEDSRNYFLMRHFVNFLFFFVAVYFFFLLIKNRYNSWIIGILGSAFLFLSPRIFAQSFYNNKDIVFMSLFIISLYTAINFLEKPDFRNAIIFSIISSLAIDIRILGVVLPTLVFLVYIINIYWVENYKKNTIKPLILFLILTPFFITLFWPYLWQDPLGNFITIFKSLSNFDEDIYNFYLGQYISAKNLPWHYPIVWIFISTPLFYIILFIVGFIFIIRRFMRRVINIEENDYYNNFWKGKKELQDLIFFSSFIIPLFVVIALNSTLYDGWRHLYFIYPRFLMMSLLGLHIIKILFFKKNKNLLLILSFLLLSPTLIWMFKYHPYQNVYFNFLAGKDFNNKFELDYWGLSNVNALKYIAENEDGDINVSRVGLSDLHLSKAFLSEKYRNKLSVIDDIKNSHYIINNYRNLPVKNINKNSVIPPNYKIFYEIIIDGVPINTIYKKVK